MNASALVRQLWNRCGLPRGDGMSRGGPVEPLACLLWLKMAGPYLRSM